MVKKWCARRDLNSRPSRYERPALTTELQAQLCLVGDLGIEPSCLTATDLQSAAVANAAHHPLFVFTTPSISLSMTIGAEKAKIIKKMIM
jgi:hypothetical protein